MAPLPSNLTSRIYFDYTTGTSPTSKPHSTMLRTSRTISDAPVLQEIFRLFLSSLTAIRFRVGWRVTGVRWSSAGSNFSVPVPIIPTLQAFVGTVMGSASPLEEATEDSFQARSFTSGRRCDLSLYRAHGVPEGTFRIEAGGGGFPQLVGAAIAVLNSAAAVNDICCLDQTRLIWSPYMNQNVNSYWEARQRS